MRVAASIVAFLVATSTAAEDATLPTEGWKVVDGFNVVKEPTGRATVTKSDDISVGRWQVQCPIDQMTDKRNCAIVGDVGGLSLFFGDSQEPLMMCVFGHNFPGKTALIRLDMAPPITTDKDGCVQDAESIRALSTAKVFKTRWSRFPFNASVDTATQLIGLNVAIGIVHEFQANKLD